MKCVTVAAGVLWDKEYCLVARRPVGKPGAGYWEFPGGKVESGETPEEALVRELREELGVVVRRFHFWKEVDHKYLPNIRDNREETLRVRIFFFHVTEFDGTPKAAEGHELRWITPRAAASLDFLEADKELVAELATEYAACGLKI